MIGVLYGRKFLKECLSFVVTDADSYRFFLDTRFDIGEIVRMESKRLTLYDFFFLDLKALKDDEIEGLIQNLNSILMLLKGRLILISDEKEKTYVDSLVAAGFYNLIFIKETSTKEEIASEMKLAMSKSGITRYLEAKEKEEDGRSVFERLYKEELPPEEESQIEEVIYQLKLKDPDKRPVMVSFSGLYQNTETTFLALNLASFLSKRGLNVAYVQHNESYETQAIASFYGASLENEYYNFEGLHLYLNDDLKNYYDVVITDYGPIDDMDISQFSIQNVRVIVCAYTLRKLFEYKKKREKWAEYDVGILSYLKDKKVQDFIMKMFAGDTYYWVDFPGSVFDSISNKDKWLKLLHDYIIEDK